MTGQEEKLPCRRECDFQPCTSGQGSCRVQAQETSNMTLVFPDSSERFLMAWGSSGLARSWDGREAWDQGFRCPSLRKYRSVECRVLVSGLAEPGALQRTAHLL